MWEKAPFFRTFWIEKPWLIAGPYPFAENAADGKARLRAIIAGGVRFFINLTTPGELNNTGIPLINYAPQARVIAEELACTVELRQIPIKDGNIPTAWDLKDILTILESNQKQDRYTYLHCWGGRGRTATVTACWLISSRHITGKETIDILKKNLNFNSAGPWNYLPYGGPILETEIQTQFVKQFRRYKTGG